MFDRKIGWLLLALAGISFAEILPETEGMRDTRGDGTFLTASPTYVFDRGSKLGGIHSESEEWTPGAVRNRYLVNRISETPSWTPHEPSVWLAVGNELGDLMYQDPLLGGYDANLQNRTPLLEAGFRSKSYDGFWATARFFQIDHYSSGMLSVRKNTVQTAEYSIFGENLPFMSTAYAGLGFSGSAFETSLLAGHEYLWLYSESGRWIPVEYKPRAELRFDSRYVRGNAVFENAEYAMRAQGKVSSRRELSGSFILGDSAASRPWNLSLGVAFRVVDDSAQVPFGIEDDYVAFPFLEFFVLPAKPLRFAGFIGTSGRDFAGKDSLELQIPTLGPVASLIGIKNHVASALNPLGEDYEFFDDDTLHLKTDGFMQLHRAYFDVQSQIDFVELGMSFGGWIEKGAETFSPKKYRKEKSGGSSAIYRTGDVDRIDSWIKGFSGEALARFHYGQMFAASARAGFERIDGDEERFEVNPVENWIVFDVNWNLWDRFSIQHSWNYRSDAKWNLRTENPYTVKGGWYWDASFAQKFPSYGLTLSATILHAIGKAEVQVPGGGEDRTRFYCNVIKAF